MARKRHITEADILGDIFVPRRGDMPTEAARSILAWRFSARATRRMRTLLNRNNNGLLTQAEEAELDRYRRVGLLLDLLQAKARVSLKGTETAS